MNVSKCKPHLLAVLVLPIFFICPANVSAESHVITLTNVEATGDADSTKPSGQSSAEKATASAKAILKSIQDAANNACLAHPYKVDGETWTFQPDATYTISSGSGGPLVKVNHGGGFMGSYKDPKTGEYPIEFYMYNLTVTFSEVKCTWVKAENGGGVIDTPKEENPRNVHEEDLFFDSPQELMDDAFLPEDLGILPEDQELMDELNLQ